MPSSLLIKIKGLLFSISTTNLALFYPCFFDVPLHYG
jgi:hypothetical protein